MKLLNLMRQSLISDRLSSRLYFRLILQTPLQKSILFRRQVKIFQQS